MRSQVVLPTELQQALLEELRGVDRLAVRTAARLMWDHLQNEPSLKEYPDKFSEGGQRSKKERLRRALAIEKHTRRQAARYDDLGSLAYAVGLLPHAYSATFLVLAEVRQRVEHAVGSRAAFSPKRVVDWGSGTGSVAWAAEQIWPSVESYTGLEKSIDMRDIAQRLRAPVGDRLEVNLSNGSFFDDRHTYKSMNPRENNIGFVTPFVQGRLPDAESTLAIGAFTLGELGHAERRRLVRAMWNSGAEIIALIEYGSPAGFARIASARDLLLRLGRESLSAQSADSRHDEMLDTLTGQVTPVVPPLKAGSHVIAPVRGASFHEPPFVTPVQCPHDGVCPLQDQYDFCHFEQSYRPAEAEQKLFADKVSELSTSYSYVVVGRGSRPAMEVSKHGSSLLSSTDPVVSTKQQDMRIRALAWPRILYPPTKRATSVTVDACSPSQRIERWTISKSRDQAQIWHDANKSRWGDLFPHKPTGPVQVRGRGIKRVARMPRHRHEHKADVEKTTASADGIDLTAVLIPREPVSSDLDA